MANVGGVSKSVHTPYKDSNKINRIISKAQFLLLISILVCIYAMHFESCGLKFKYTAYTIFLVAPTYQVLNSYDIIVLLGQFFFYAFLLTGEVNTAHCKMAALQLNNKTLRYITSQTSFPQVPILLWNGNIYCLFIIIWDCPAEAERT